MNIDKLIDLIEQGNEQGVFNQEYWVYTLVDMVQEATGMGREKAWETVYDLIENKKAIDYDIKSKTIKINYERLRK